MSEQGHFCEKCDIRHGEACPGPWVSNPTIASLQSRVKDLEAEIQKERQEVGAWKSVAGGALKTEHENLRLRTALEFYADRNSWRSPNYDCETKSEITTSDLGCKSFSGENDFADYAIPSGGRRAREALSPILAAAKHATVERDKNNDSN